MPRLFHAVLYRTWNAMLMPGQSVRLAGVELRRVIGYFGSCSKSPKREYEILSHAYTKAIKWRFIGHPLRGKVELDGSERCTRYVEDWEIVEALSLTSKRKLGSIRALQAYIRRTSEQRWALASPSKSPSGSQSTPRRFLAARGS